MRKNIKIVLVDKRGVNSKSHSFLVKEVVNSLSPRVGSYLSEDNVRDYLLDSDTNIKIIRK